MLSSCSFFLKKLGGIKDPQMESFHSVNEYSKTLTIDSSSIVFAKDSAAFFKINKMFAGSPEIIVFNGSKKYIPYKNDSSSCNASVDNVLKTLCQINEDGVKTRRVVEFDSLFSCFADPNQSLKTFELAKYDYVVFINYAKFADGINKTHIIPWNKIIKENVSSCKTKYIFVNMDYLESWGIKESSLPKFKIKTTS